MVTYPLKIGKYIQEYHAGLRVALALAEPLYMLLPELISDVVHIFLFAAALLHKLQISGLLGLDCQIKGPDGRIIGKHYILYSGLGEGDALVYHIIRKLGQIVGMIAHTLEVADGIEQVIDMLLLLFRKLQLIDLYKVIREDAGHLVHGLLLVLDLCRLILVRFKDGLHGLSDLDPGLLAHVDDLIIS